MKTLKLCLHCGGQSATREEIEATSTPDGTDRWKPIPHARLLTDVESALGKLNMRIVNQTYGIAKEGKRMFGLMQIANCKGNTDYSFVAGIRNSHDKSFPAGFCVGSGVFVCDNLAFFSEIVFGRRHTTYILDDLPVLINTAVGKLAEKWDVQGSRIEKYKTTEIGKKDAVSIIIDAAVGEVFPESRVMDVYREFINPRHPEFKEKTVWSLFNAVTENLKPRAESKGTTLWTLPARTQRLHNLCDSFCGIEMESPVANN